MATASVIRDNAIQEADDSEVDVEIASPVRLLGSHTNIIPLANTVQTTRSFYGSRMANQAMPLKDPEQSYVQVLNPETGKSFESEYGESMGARMWKSDKGGTVKAIHPDYITVTDDDGNDHDVDMYDNFEFNRKTQITNRPVVKVGDKVKPGQLLAASNYTDDNGTLSLGKNARTAVVPYKGYSMDDAIVVSESFAKRMTSLHAYESSLQKDQDTKFGKTHYTSLFPTKFTQEQLATLDDNGVVRKGTVLHKGDPIILATRPKTLHSNTEALGKLGKVFRTLRNDAAEVWEHDYPGYVTGNADGKKNVKAFVTAEVPLKVGDKLIASRPGQKSIVSKIIPDEQMLRSLDGKPFEVLLNPLALPSRINTATLHELALGKVAATTGKPFTLPSFQDNSVSRLDETYKALQDAGISPTEEVFDPVLNRKLGQPVSTGSLYMYKLHHVVESKKSARGQGAYDQSEQPVRGGGENAQSKRLGGLEVTALLSKGGIATLREASTLRGQANDSYWSMVRQGYKPAEPGTPFIFNKFLYMLNGAGMGVEDKGRGQLRLHVFTDRHLREKNPRMVLNGDMIKPDSLEGVDDGLFDKNLVAHNSWGFIPLSEPMVNPAAEGIVLNLLGMKQKDFRKVLAGEMPISEARGIGKLKRTAQGL